MGAHNFNIEFNGSNGDNCYLIFGNIVVEVGSYFNSSAGVIYFTFDNHSVGNGRLEWNTVTELGVTKTFILGSENYDIKWIGFGSFLFGINSILPPVPPEDDNYVVDEYDNFISDENGNDLSF